MARRSAALAPCSAGVALLSLGEMIVIYFVVPAVITFVVVFVVALMAMRP